MNNSDTSLYPLKFKPILKSKIWGGTKLNRILNKDSDQHNVGESWEISDVKGDVSVVSNGALEGESLNNLIHKYKGQLVGKRVFQQFGNTFPLLIKFIDAKTDLSIQLHPNDELAAKRHNSFGKTEMWYVMQADPKSRLIVGFKDGVTKGDYKQHLQDKTLPAILNFEEVSKGDAYFIEAGRVHAIGGGILLAEIQQTSDITYRVYDWDRIDDDGKERELHTELALDAINFDMPNNYKVTYSTNPNQHNPLVDCHYFSTKYLKLTNKLQLEHSADSFTIYMCVSGSLTLGCGDLEMKLSIGETVLVPAVFSDITLDSQDAELLEIRIEN